MDRFFHGARSKLSWARKLAFDIEDVISAHLALRPISIVEQHTPDLSRRRFVLRLEKAIPDSLAMLTCDCSGNIRSALDLAIADVLRAQQLPVKRSQFPIGDDEKSFLESLSRCLGKKRPGELDRILKEARPYRGGNDLLYHLKEIDNLHKHNELIIVTAMVRAPPIRVGGIDWHSNFIGLTELGEEVELVQMTYNQSYTIGDESSIGLRIEFGNGSLLGAPIAERLRAMNKAASDVVACLERYGRPFIGT